MSNKDKKNMELKNELNKDGLSEFVNKKDVALTPEEIQALAAAKAIELREKDKKLAEEREAEAKKEERGKKIRKWLMLGIMILIILLLMVRCSQLPLPEQVQEFIDKAFEDTVGQDEVPEKEEKPYDARFSMLTISMNKVPVFENGKAKGNLQILNDEKNVYNQFVEIYILDEDGNEFLEPVYTSGLIGIGQVLQEDTLDENLPAGKYNAVAYFTAVHPETNAIAGKAGAKIEITVLNTVQ